MSNERLEEIKNGTYLYFRKHNELKEDMDWLIEQAERVQELEEERDEWKYTAQSYYMTNQELREQNKRYREALEKISAPIDKVTYAYMFAVKQIARQVKHWRVRND